jgi:hypothetical protein
VIVSAGKRWLSGLGKRPVTRAQHEALVGLLERGAGSSRSRPTMLRSKMFDEAAALSPRAENVLDGCPTFVWRPSEPGSRYEVALFRGGASVAPAIRAIATSVAYPADRAPLQPGRYQWQIHVTTPTGKQDMDEAEFTVLDAAAARKARAELDAARALLPAEAGVNLPLVGVYIKYRLYTPAKALLDRALDATPEDETLLRALREIRGRLGAEGSPGPMLAP